MADIADTIEHLIAQRAEGVYWDYKELHHACKYDFVHDVLCLANARHQGPRYIIFGVSDSGIVKSARKDKDRRSQAGVADLFRSIAPKFANQQTPEINLTTVRVRSGCVDVLTIGDRPHKPYYLVEKYGKVRPHHVYTRTCDTNTPINESAAPHEIERMYMERAGLGVPLIDRIKKYVRDAPGWTRDPTHEENEVWYYRPFPEITMRAADPSKTVAHNEEWTRGEIVGANNLAYYQEIWFHQTCVVRVRCVIFDDRKKHIVAPDWESIGRGRFYYYDSDSVGFALQKHLIEREGVNHSETLGVGRLRDKELESEICSRFGQYLRIPVLRASELRGFLDVADANVKVEPSSDGVEQYHLFVEEFVEV